MLCDRVLWCVHCAVVCVVVCCSVMCCYCFCFVMWLCLVVFDLMRLICCDWCVWCGALVLCCGVFALLCCGVVCFSFRCVYAVSVSVCVCCVSASSFVQRCS